MSAKLSEHEKGKLFSLLKKLGDMDHESLLEEFTDENLKGLRLLAGELNGNLTMEKVMSQKRFTQMVRELAQTMEIWSGRFDETVTLARKAALAGKKDQARWILSGFVRFCPSPYYREKAGKVMDEVG